MANKLELIPEDIWTRRNGPAVHTELLNKAIEQINQLASEVKVLKATLTNIKIEGNEE